MNKIFILGANNEQLGPFTSAEVRQGLTMGKYRQDQMAFAEGLGQWTPLVDVLVHVDRTSPAPAPAPAPVYAPAPSYSPAPSLIQQPGVMSLPTTSYVPIQSSMVAGLTSNMNYAPFPMRLAACFIDNIILTIGSLIVTMVESGLMIAVAPHDGTNDPSNPNPLAIIIVFFAWGFNIMIYVLYFAVQEGSAMQGTIGKSVLGLKVTDEMGNPIGFPQALGRAFSRILSWIICYIGFFVSLGTDRKQALHDIIAKTIVVTR